MKILALATFHNRRDLTLRSVDCLLGQIMPTDAHLEICLVDDGSSDGTASALALKYPEVVVLQGPGNLYWAGGMRYGWDNFAKNSEFDYLFVFNDDVKLFDHALSSLLGVGKTLEAEGCNVYAVSGALADPNSGNVAYGGVTRSSSWHPMRFGRVAPTGRIQECDTINMNATLISSSALKKIGFLSLDFTHAKADFDFGLRLRKAGGRIALAAHFVGECDTNSTSGTWEDESLSYMERWRSLTGIKAQPPKERAIYYRRHGGWLWPCFWALPYIRISIRLVAAFMCSALTKRKGT